MTDETRPDAVTEPADPQTPPPAAPAAPEGAPTEQGDQTSAETASAPGEGTPDLADTTNPGDDLDPDDLKVADLDPADTPNPYTGGDVTQDDEATEAPA